LRHRFFFTISKALLLVLLSKDKDIKVRDAM